MHKFFLLMMAILVCQPSFAQKKNEVNEALKILKEYWAVKDLNKLEEVETIIEKVFEDEAAMDDPKAHFAKAQFMTAQIMLEDFTPEDTSEFLSEYNNSFEMALKKDVRNSHRYFILEKLYSAKAQLGQLGANQYVESNYEEALHYYNSATFFNELEIKYPRTVRPDTSTIYTTAVVAKLAKDNSRAIELFQSLVDMEYNRADIYDYLINLYEKENFDVKARKVEILRNKRFPEDK